MLPKFRETVPGAGASRAGKVPYPTVLKSTGSQGLPLVSTGGQSTPVLSIRPTLVPLHDTAHTVGLSWYPRRNPQKDCIRAGVFWVDCFPNQTTWTPEFFSHCQYSNSAHTAYYWKNDRSRLHMYLQDNPAYCLVVCILIANKEKKSHGNGCIDDLLLLCIFWYISTLFQNRCFYGVNILFMQLLSLHRNSFEAVWRIMQPTTVFFCFIWFNECLLLNLYILLKNNIFIKISHWCKVSWTHYTSVDF